MKEHISAPEISVIVPVYNVEKYLNRCIDSILAQTFPDIEVILVDDGSTDNSGKICDDYSRIDDRIVVYHKENGGVSSARNLGLDYAKGKYIIFCDSDDEISPHLAIKCKEYIEKNDLDCIIYCYKYLAEEETQSMNNKEGCLVPDMELLDHTTAFQMILEGKEFRMMACNKMYKAKTWKDIRFPVGRRYGEDTSVTYRIIDKCDRIGYLREPLYYYRKRDGSALHSKINQDNLQLFDSYDELIEYTKIHHECLLEYAYYAYAIRLFDFISKAIDYGDRSFIKKVRVYIRRHWNGLKKTHRLTNREKKILYVVKNLPSLYFFYRKSKRLAQETTFNIWKGIN